MKIRTGHVSNSSSSSFIIAVKGNVKNDKELKSLLFQKIEIPKGIFETINRKLVEALVYCSGECGDVFTGEEGIERYCKEIAYDKEENLSSADKALCEKMRQGWNIFLGNASNDADPEEAMLYDMSITYEDDEFFIDKQGGF